MLKRQTGISATKNVKKSRKKKDLGWVALF